MAKTCFLVSMMKLFLFRIFLLSLIHTISPSLAITNITTDQSALLALKSHITHDPQNLLATNWSISTPVCNWVGVTCGLRHQRVTVLNVSYFGLTGTIPPHIGNLSFLTELRFKNNSFHGSLPIELTHLRRLKLISFGYNNFMGEIPSWIWSLSKLEWLGLYGNQFSGSITKEIGNAAKLRELWLYKNHLTGEIPPEIGKLELEALSIFYNSFTGTFPSIIYNMSSLRKLDLSNNNFYGNILPDYMCDTLPNLEMLYLQNCQLHGRIPPQLSQCGKLHSLSLQSNNLTGSIPSVLFNMSHLEYLQLSKNNFESTIFPDNICQNLPNLVFLALEECNLTGRIPTQLFQCGKLRAISLAINNFVGSIPHTIGNLTNLEELFLNSNKFTDMVAHVADFGIAKLVSGSDSITQTMTLATIGYMAPEYGLEGVVSTKGDVYSYGILLMETFTGKKPTDAMFEGELSLKKWVEDALAHKDVTNVADASFLEGQNLVRVKECLLSTFKLALCCTTESPIERKNMKEISTQLNKKRQNRVMQRSRGNLSEIGENKECGSLTLIFRPMETW